METIKRKGRKKSLERNSVKEILRENLVQIRA